MTIFEIKEKKTKNSDLSNAANVMRQLKSKNSHIIEKFKGETFSVLPVRFEIDSRYSLYTNFRTQATKNRSNEKSN